MGTRLFIPAIIMSLLTSTSMAMAFDGQQANNTPTNQLQQVIDKNQEQGCCCCKHHDRGEGREEFMQKLQKAGITKEQFEAAKAQGHEAVRELLKSHGIEPKKDFHREDSEKTTSSPSQ